MNDDQRKDLQVYKRIINNDLFKPFLFFIRLLFTGSHCPCGTSSIDIYLDAHMKKINKYITRQATRGFLLVP